MHSPSINSQIFRCTISIPRKAFPQPDFFFSLKRIHTQRFKPFFPPPSTLSKPGIVRTYPGTRKWLRRLFYVSLGGGVVYGIDRWFYASSLTRTTCTFALGMLVALDYKINFRPNPPFAESIAAVHARNADRLSSLLRANGGLYLKIGQAIAMQSAILPPEFQRMFARMFDDAPQNDWKDVARVIEEDFGRPVDEVFGISFDGNSESGSGVMERNARASASVAQVHWARLPDGREVAIKVQKKEIAQQVKWDLWAFKYVLSPFFPLLLPHAFHSHYLGDGDDLDCLLCHPFEFLFFSSSEPLPPANCLIPFVSERLYLETDFENEANNSERMAKLVAAEPRLRRRVYIPKVYRELSSKRVMTAEWIEGVKLWDKHGITRPWRGGWRQGSPGCHGTPLDPPSGEGYSAPFHAAASRDRYEKQHENLKPIRDHWKGRNGHGGLGLSLKEVMTTMVDLFSAQIFLWGWLHCDPHPGNVLVRRRPSGQAELVLIDHGLYIHMEPKFRHEYAQFWKALLTFDNSTLHKIVRGWGVTNTDIFASATLMRPYRGGDLSTFKGIEGLSKKEKAHRHFEMQQAMRKAARGVLGDETKWPRELIFISRNFRIVQANNQYLGSPVNRIKITGIWASRALVEIPDLSLTEKIRNYGRHVVFKLVLLSSDIWFYVSKLRQFLGRGGGMEDDIEAQMQKMAKEMGVELNQNIFEG
ncbi:ABC1 domain-containing protein [Paracoccidioides lutzii Pb01]|uniref:ABC1 domain-containing protein n=1 Tax=Paracoccidioides lutzii (strain ATCC MYA-826 / Pb01) TaxID=502779 RepID=C1H466_PARBA|nr:ABC1 domain-containing protein [Paracoccidioides lutzii Pb01]EEH34510.2 ABC1 domain-containing protein [Paracoccidioides lutzii Pb01]